MPSEGRRLHAFTVVSGALRIARQLLLPALLGGASAGDSIDTFLRWGLLILAVPSLVIAFAQWLAFRYRLEGDELLIDSGVLSRRRRVIPLARVQNIDLEEGFLERLAGVAELRLETASGGSDAEARLAVLARADARELQAALLERRMHARHVAAHGHPGPTRPGATGLSAPIDPAASPAGAAISATTPPAGPPPRRILRLSPFDLAIAGATSNEAGLIAAGLATLVQAAEDLGGLDWLGNAMEGLWEQAVVVGVIGAVAAGAILALAFFLLGWVLSIVATTVRYHGFTLVRDGEDLRREYGLLSRHRSTLPIERIQAVRIEESLLRRPLGLAKVRIETAGAGPRNQSGQDARTEAVVPLARRRDVERILEEAFGDGRLSAVPLHPVAPIAHRREFVRLAVPTIVAGLVLTIVLDRPWAALFLLLVPAWWLAGAQYRSRGWARTAGYTVVRGGVFNRVTWVVPDRKIQTLHLRATPFQRLHDIATVMIDTAAGGRVAHVTDVRQGTGMGLLATLARDAESARRATLRSTPAG